MVWLGQKKSPALTAGRGLSPYLPHQGLRAGALAITHRPSSRDDMRRHHPIPCWIFVGKRILLGIRNNELSTLTLTTGTALGYLCHIKLLSSSY